MPPSTQSAPAANLKQLVLLLCWCVFCSVLNGTMFNVAVPDIARDYQLSPAAVSWIITGYITLFAIGAVSYGKLADRYPVRRLLTIGLVLFNLGALGSLLATSYPLLIAGRMLQASGGAAIPALVMIIATRFAPPDQRGRVLGAVGATVALGMGCGPLFGGLLAGLIHWRWLFALSFATLPAIPWLRRALPQESLRPGRFDLLGAGLLTLALSGLLVGLTQRLPWLILPALLIFGLLLGHLKRHPEPFIDPRLLRLRDYRAGLLIVLLVLGTVFGLLFLTPLALRELYGVSTLKIGLLIFPGALCGSLVGLYGGRLADRSGCRRVGRAGLAILLSGYLLFAWWIDSGPLSISLLLMLGYAGFSLFQPAIGKAVSLTLPVEQSGLGMGLYNLIYFLSGAIGTALCGSLLLWIPPGNDPVWPYRLIFLLMLPGVACGLLLIGRLPDQPGQQE